MYFKFRAINKHLIESLVRPSLYFAKPDRLNDPFDCRLDVYKSFKRAASMVTGDRRISFEAALRNKDLLLGYKRQFETFGVCSFSLLEGSLDEPLLWSHYADEHRGVCLLYRFPMVYLDDPKTIFGASEVRYENDALTNWLSNSTIAPEDVGFVGELTKIFLTSKNPAWKYEKEARIIRSEHGVFDIPQGFLIQVCFGLRTPQSDIDLITNLAMEYSGCNKFCHMIHDEDSDFGIKAVEI